VRTRYLAVEHCPRGLGRFGQAVETHETAIILSDPTRAGAPIGSPAGRPSMCPGAGGGESSLRLRSPW
jgi:hypothetical protein